jgi:hypothetical protein
VTPVLSSDKAEQCCFTHLVSVIPLLARATTAVWGSNIMSVDLIDVRVRYMHSVRGGTHLHRIPRG